MTASEIERAMLRTFPVRQSIMVPNVQWDYGESDLVRLTLARY